MEHQGFPGRRCTPSHPSPSTCIKYHHLHMQCLLPMYSPMTMPSPYPQARSVHLTHHGHTPAGADVFLPSTGQLDPSLIIQSISFPPAPNCSIQSPNCLIKSYIILSVFAVCFSILVLLGSHTHLCLFVYLFPS